MYVDIGKFMVERARKEAEIVAERIAKDWKKGFPYFLGYFKEIYKGEGDPEEVARVMWKQITVVHKWQKYPEHFQNFIRDTFVGLALVDDPVFKAVEPLMGLRLLE